MPSSGKHTYSNMIGFFARGKHYFVVVQDERNVVIINEEKHTIQMIELQPGIRSIQRYSAYIMVQYDHHLEFILFDQAQVLETVSKVSLKETIN